MHDTNPKYVGDHLAYAPRGISPEEYGYFASSGFWSAQIYWRDEGFPFILHEFLRIPEGEVLEIWPVGNHTLFDAAVFINHRIKEIYEYVVLRRQAQELGKGPLLQPKFDISKWQLGPIPGSRPTDPTPLGLKSVDRKTGS